MRFENVRLIILIIGEEVMIRFDKEVCGNLESALGREWIETNGIGGFASSTVAGLNTRRYHGLLTAATRPPVGRLVLLAKLEETLILDGRRFELSANRYPGVVHPQGHQHLKEFALDPFPVFTYEVEGVVIEKRVFMIYGENSVVIQYDLRSMNQDLAECTLEARPLIAFRDYHSTTHENLSLNAYVRVEPNQAEVAPYSDMPGLRFAHDAEEIDTSGNWYRNFEYDAERERGLDFSEDLYSPFALKFNLNKRHQAAIIASLERHDINQANRYRLAEIERRKRVVAAAPHAGLRLFTNI